MMTAGKKQEDSTEWVSVPNAARELGCSRQGILTSIISGELDGDHRAGRTTVSRESLDRLKAQRQAGV